MVGSILIKFNGKIKQSKNVKLHVQNRVIIGHFIRVIRKGIMELQKMRKKQRLFLAEKVSGERTICKAS